MSIGMRLRAAEVRTFVFFGTTLPRSQRDQQLAIRLRNLLPLKEGVVTLDVERDPELFLHPYVELAKIYAEYGIASFQPVPLTTSLIPGYFTIDTEILKLCVVKDTRAGMPYSYENKNMWWSQVFNLHNKAFGRHPLSDRTARNDRVRGFQGTMMTDLVGVSIIISKPSEQGWGRKRKTINVNQPDPNDIYLNQQTASTITTPNIMVIDPNKRDLNYGLGPHRVTGMPVEIRLTNASAWMILMLYRNQGRKSADPRKSGPPVKG